MSLDKLIAATIAAILSGSIIAGGLALRDALLPCADAYAHIDSVVESSFSDSDGRDPFSDLGLLLSLAPDCFFPFHDVS